MSADSDYILNVTVDDTANFKHDNRRLVGHLVALTVGGEELKKDFSFVNPMNPSERVPICGIVTFAQWNKKPGGLLLLEGRISSGNQGILQDAIDSGDKSAECEFNLNVYKYNYATKSYYKCFHTDDKSIKAQLSEESPSNVSDELAEEYRQIANHRYVIATVGSDEKDELFHIAYSPDRKKTFAFGQKCGA